MQSQSSRIQKILKPCFGVPLVTLKLTKTAGNAYKDNFIYHTKQCVKLLPRIKKVDNIKDINYFATELGNYFISYGDHVIKISKDTINQYQSALNELSKDRN